MTRIDKAILIILLSFIIFNCRNDPEKKYFQKVMAITESGDEIEANYSCLGKLTDTSSDKLPKISLGGKVMEMYGQKISGAVVSLIGLNISSISDTDGDVILEGVPAQTRVNILTEPPTYGYNIKSVATFNILTPTVTTLDFSFYLAHFPKTIKPIYPYACFGFPFFEGFIKDCSNNAIINAKITFEDLEGNEIKDSIIWYKATDGCDSSKAGSMTLSPGRFWISNIPPGEFFIKAWGVLNNNGKQVLLGKIKIIYFPDAVLWGTIDPD